MLVATACLVTATSDRLHDCQRRTVTLVIGL
jgi:hypothetical protein